MTTYRACPSCSARVVWATTKTGKRQCLDYTPSHEGNVAAWQDHLGGWHARTITAYSSPVIAPERLYMPHWASHPQCRPPAPAAKQAAAEVVTFLDEYRRGQAAHNAGKRRRKPRVKKITGYRITPGRN
jgi:hypothetical protein